MNNFICPSNFIKHPYSKNLWINKGGKVWTNSRRKTILKGSPNTDGYITFNVDGKTRKLHQLILETFVGPCPEGKECRHLDGDKTNNNLSNLCWGTHSENQLDSLRHGTHNIITNHPRRKLTNQQIRQIIYEYRTGLFTMKELGCIYKVTDVNIRNIVNRKTWKSIWKGLTNE